jgi:hypothetical protein
MAAASPLHLPDAGAVRLVVRAPTDARGPLGAVANDAQEGSAEVCSEQRRPRRLRRHALAIEAGRPPHAPGFREGTSERSADSPR